MIKIWHRLGSCFSTIRFRDSYKNAFEVAHQLRTYNSIQALQGYLEKQKEKITTFAKTEALEFFNQYRINFNNGKIGFLLFARNFQDLNIYEEQLRFSCILKIIQYSPRSIQKYIAEIKQAEERIISRLKDKEFDFVDALNILTLKSYFSSNQLLDKALQTLFKNDIIKYENTLTRCASIIVKRMIDLDWCKLRKYRSLLSFLCYSYINSHLDIKAQIVTSSRIIEWQLHLVGYDSLPICIAPNYNRIESQRSSVDPVLLQTAFQSLQFLPQTEFTYRKYKYLLNEVRLMTERSLIYPQCLPFALMTLAETYLTRWINFYSSIYYLSKQKAFFFFFHHSFMEKAHQYFVKDLSLTKVRSNTEFAGIVGLANKLYNYYRFDEPKVEQIVKFIKKVAKQYAAKNAFKEIITSLSLCNLIFMKCLNKELNLFSAYKDIPAMIESSQQTYNDRLKKNNSLFKTKGFCEQVGQLIVHFANTTDDKMRQMLFTIIKSNFVDGWEKTNSFDEDLRARIIFEFYKSNNHAYFMPLTDMLSSFYASEPIALAELFLVFTHKTQMQTIRIISKIWQLSNNFTAIAKILAYSSFLNLSNKDRQLDTQIKDIIFEASIYITKQSIQMLSIGDIEKLLKFCNYFLEEIKQFTQKFLLLSIGRIQKNFAEKGINFGLLRQLLKIGNRIRVRQTLLSGLIDSLLQKLQSSLRSQDFSLQSFQLFIQSSSFLNSNNEAAEKLKQKLTQKLNSRSFIFKNKVSQLPLALSLFLDQSIQLSADGDDHVKQSIKKALIAHQIFPNQLKSALQLTTFSLKDLPQHKLLILKDLLEFCLKSIKVQQGTQFYFWCLQLGHSLNSLSIATIQCKQIMLQALQLMPLCPIDSHLLNRILDILKRYPNLVSKQFNMKVVYALKMPSLNLTNSFIPIFEYFNVIYYEMPSEIMKFFNHYMVTIQNYLSNDWKELFEVGISTSKKTNILQTYEKSYLYLSLVIKENAICAATSEIYKYCLHAKKRRIKEIIEGEPLYSLDHEKVKLINTYFSKSKSARDGEQKLSFFSKDKYSANKTEKQSSLGTSEVFQSYPKPDFVQLPSLQNEFNRLNIKSSQSYLSDKDFYSYDFIYRGLKVRYFLKYKERHYSIVPKSKALRNQEGMIGQPKFFENVYKKVYQIQTLYLDPENMKLELGQLSQ